MWGDYACIEGGGRLLESPIGLAGFPVLGTLFVAGFDAGRELVEACRAIAPQARRPGRRDSLAEFAGRTLSGDVDRTGSQSVYRACGS